MTTQKDYDFIVIGAGSAGAVVAARLSESATARILLLEAGPRDTSPWIHLPIGFSKTFRNPAVNWMYESDPEPHLNHRRIYWPKGKVLGGSSSINGLIYLRGLPSDYDSWNERGNLGWTYDKVAPFFEMVENTGSESAGIAREPGRVGLSFPSWRTDLSEAFIEAARSMTGERRDDGFNAGKQLGGGYFLHTQHRGLRTSSATAYLAPLRRKPNLDVVTGALVCQIELEQGRARGVRYRKGTEQFFARSDREIVICAGAINTPQLLQLSGVGPAQVLERAGVNVKHELQGVGANFHDHFTVRVTVGTASTGTTLNSVAGSLAGKASVGLEWLVKRTGPLTIGAGVAGAYVKTSPQASEPDVQLILVPFKTDKLYKGLTRDAGFQILVTPSRPSSRGQIQIRSADASHAPSMYANYMETEADRRLAVDGLRAALAIIEAREMKPFVQEELAPGQALRTDSELLRYAVETGSSTQHQAGSCRMGADRLAVVDSELRVHGLDGLRIADASVMPQVVSANINAACLMIGERCADFIKQSHGDCFPVTGSVRSTMRRT